MQQEMSEAPDKGGRLTPSEESSKKEMRTRANSRDSDMSDCSRSSNSTAATNTARANNYRGKKRKKESNVEDRSEGAVYPKAKRMRRVSPTSSASNNSSNSPLNTSPVRTRRRNARVTAAKMEEETVGRKDKKRVLRLRGNRKNTLTIRMAEFTSSKSNRGDSEDERSSRASDDGCSDDASSECGSAASDERSSKPHQSFQDDGEDSCHFNNEHCNLSLLVSARPPLRPDKEQHSLHNNDENLKNIPDTGNSSHNNNTLPPEDANTLHSSAQNTDSNLALTPHKNKDIYDFEEEDTLASSPSLGLRRSPQCGSSPRTPFESSSRWGSPSGPMPVNGTLAEGQMTPPNKPDPKRLKIKLRKLHMKRSPVLDEVIELGANIPATSDDPFQTQYEVMDYDGVPEGSPHCYEGDPPENNPARLSRAAEEDTPVTCRKLGRRAGFLRRKRNSSDDEEGSVDSGSMKPINRHIKTVKLILGPEVNTRTVEISY